VEPEAGQGGGATRCGRHELLDVLDGFASSRDLVSIHGYAQSRCAVTLQLRILACSRSCQDDAEARVPPPKLARLEVVVREQEVEYRVRLAGRACTQVWADQRIEATLVGGSPPHPVLLRKDGFLGHADR
jgi:hypothetical protein